MDEKQRLNFDQLVELFRSSPEQFNEYHRSVVQAEINKVPDGPRRRKLNALQWELDVMKRRYKNPTAWNNQLHAMMLARMAGLGKALRVLMGDIKK